MATLAEIRAKLKAQDAKTSSGGPIGDNAIYPHWNIAEGTEAVLRFLPDKDPNNTFFWAERAMIKLPFNSVKGESTGSVQVQVPCMEMWGEPCSILAEVRGWFKDKSLEDMGRKYWKKRSYIFQGFVNESPLQEDTTPENPIRRFIIGPQIFQIIKQALMDPDMEELPTDYTAGVDFRLNKTTKGGYADYSTSSWARRERPLGDAEMKAVETHGLFNLNDFLPKKPGEVEVKVMKEMFEASVDGEAYDMDKFGQYFRPAGMAARTGDPVTQSNSSPKVEAAPEPKVESAPAPEAPKAEEPTPATSGKAEDILSMIRARQQN